LPDALSALLAAHRETQQAERDQAGSLWHDGGWVFTDQLGRPLNPRTDWDRWKQLLRAAGVREARLHDARHTAATMLVVLGVSDRTIMGMMGWSNTSMTQRYGHIVDPIRRDVAGRLDALLWSEDEVQTQPIDLDEQE
jgi:integrase